MTRQGLWAALRVNQSVFRQEETKDVVLAFTLINDGAGVVDPRIEESRILINGREAAYSGWARINGSPDGPCGALPPGAVLEFGRGLGTYFGTPGTYRVSWEGPGFQSPEVCFRVLPGAGR